ncbi:MAG: ABC transporter permease [Candidatus Rokubacteria bacterium 13_1_40CM_69_27]|nr:MAG: ABC transporter permease [Candidatus Rokubacteria bacterium 13_1_40CM_69_27]
MQRYIVGRLLQSIVSMFVVSVVVFALVRLSGDPIQIMAPPEATEADIKIMRAYLGLDRPWPIQYGRFVTRALQGDFGQSVRFRRPALDLILERYGATFELGGLAVLIVIVVALPVGVYAAVRRGTALDYAARAFAALGQAVPPFWLGLLLVLVFGVLLHLLPTSGRGTPLHIILPGITLGWFAVAGLMRLTRSSMLDVLGSEYVKLARIKGLPERQVIWKHAFKNAALPVVTFAALLFVALLNGSIIIETVFSWPGLGLLVIEAVDSRDYPIVQTVVLFLSAMYIGVNLLVDILYAYLNPKIRYSP